MNAVGQSGHPFHRHYDDLIDPYLAGEFHPSRWTREEAEASARGRRLLLEPGD
jgi:penicillin amidase